MKAVLILADAATAHPDGTFSLLRGGVSETGVPKNRPAMFRGALVVRITSARGEAGAHSFKLSCVDEDGAPVAQELSGNFDTPQQGGTVQFVWDLQLILPRLGRYEFNITVDKIQLDSWTLAAKELALPQSPTN